MNPRVSRSSALASKATGFPIAKIAAKLAVGYTLDELEERYHQDHAGQLRADHRLCRGQDPTLHLREIPRHPGAADHQHEIGRRSDGDRPQLRGGTAERAIAASRPASVRRRRARSGAGDGGSRDAFKRRPLATPRPDRLLMAAQALRAGLSVADIHETPASFDPWYPATSLPGSSPPRRKRSRGRACRATPAGCAASRRWGSPTSRPRRNWAASSEPEVAALRARLAVSCPSTSASTPVPASSPPPRPTCIRPTRANTAPPAKPAPTIAGEDNHSRRWPEPHRPGHRVRLLLRPRRSPHPMRSRKPASRPSWSTATRKPSAPTTTPPTAVFRAAVR